MKISRTMSILKFLINFCAIKQSVKIKIHLCRYCLQCFSSERVLTDHKETCFKINGTQTVKSRSGLIKFDNYSKQLSASFRIYPDFECIVKKVKSSDRCDNTSYTEKYQSHIVCNFP